MADNELTSCIFGAVNAGMMADKLVDPCTVMGYVSKTLAEETGLPEGIPIVASGADKACETLGVGCEGANFAAISMGTAASVEITTDKYVEPQPFMPAYPSIYSDKYNPEILIFRGYWMISWFKNEFAHKEVAQAKELNCLPEKLLDEHLADVPAGCEGLVLQPFWSPGTSNPEAKGAIIGFSDCHTRAHIYRAIIEGIGFALYDGLKSMEKRAGYDIKRIAASGGGANSDQVCQITADLTGKIVYKVQTYETSALGAAMAAFTGIGEYKNLSDAVKNMSRVSKEYTPNLDTHKIYTELYERVYCKLYKANKKFYKMLREIVKMKQ
jgi:Sugar (pentulose and hexulose) kinases